MNSVIDVRAAVGFDAAAACGSRPAPSGSATSSLRIADLVGQAVSYEHGRRRHGVIVKASWSSLMEPVLVIHPDDEPVAIPADHVLFGREAVQLLEQIQRSSAAAGVWS